ncbi:hypothetical protein ACFQDG_05140 [Natronoarchaeum mannanilyticum]|uniref:Lumazine-binding domain-containing protein n=1 Tax=Natronoarchaeum mannanilyticum TaxID=926360 RepID=A0AAV3T860_9EURY
MYAGLVDGTGRIESSTTEGEGHRLRIDANELVDPAVGDSVSVAGVCLTADRFAVAVLPETYDLTTLSEKDPGDPVHLEPDPVATYVERQLSTA